MKRSLSLRTYAVIGIFDERGEDFISTLWTRLNRAGIPCGIQEYRGSRPHMTFSIFTGCGKERAIAAVADIARRTGPLRIELTHLGLFTVDGITAYLGIRPGKRLLEIHRRIDAIVADCAREASPYYRADQWVPHCTLSGALDQRHTALVLDIGKTLPLPRRFRMIGLGITELDHERQSWSYERDILFD